MQGCGAASSTDVAEPVTDSTEVYKTAKEFVSVEQGQPTARSRTRSMCTESEERPLMTCISDDRIQIWRTHHLIEPILQVRPGWTKFW